MVSTNWQLYLFLLSNLDTFFSCLTVVAKTSNTMLNRSTEAKNPCIVPEFSRKAFWLHNWVLYWLWVSRIPLQCGRPGLGKSPGKGKGYPLQYSGLENSTDCIVHGVTKSSLWLLFLHLLCWGMFPLYPFHDTFYHKWMLTFVKCFFCITWGNHVVLSFPLLMWYLTKTDLHVLNHPCVTGMNSA